MMVGRDIITIERKEKKTEEEIILQLKSVCIENEDKLPAIKNLSLEIKKGEILGIAGVSGNGQKELAEAIAGLRRVKKGEILLVNIDITNKSPEFIINSGISFIPEERMVMGIIKDFSVSENAILKKHCLAPLSKWMFLNFKNIRDFTEKMVNEFNIKTSSIDTPVKNLSGGNIQKLILAREMTSETVLLIASHPTRGVDIGATEYIHNRLLEMKENGMAILLISEDLEEIIALSDRIAVIYEGEIAGIVSPSVSPETIGLMMGGETKINN
jgi:simple sugar transport system ATP-binding protein